MPDINSYRRRFEDDEGARPRKRQIVRRATWSPVRQIGQGERDGSLAVAFWIRALCVPL